MSVQKTQSTSYNLYQSGKLDEINLNAQQSKQLKGMTGWTVRKFASSKYLQYNIAKDKNLANANLRKASSLAINKKELGKKQITISLLGDDTDDAKKVAEFIQSTLESTLGIMVEVSNVPFKTRLSRVSSLKFDVVATGWTADFSDPISFLDLLTKGNAYNYGKWESTAYNKNVSLSKTTGSTAVRWKAMVAAERALLEDQGYPAVLHQRSYPS